MIARRQIQALQQYAHGDWTLDEGSSLSLYDDRYYLLKFRRPGQTAVQMCWNVPDAMDASLKSLLQISETPEEKAGACIFGAQTWRK
jgi:hypothetical protein